MQRLAACWLSSWLAEKISEIDWVADWPAGRLADW